jgi:hypothetical protein
MKDDQLDLAIQKLRWLRLPGMAEQLRPLLAKAAKENLSGLDLVDRLSTRRRPAGSANAVARRIRDARFPEVNTVDGFDFDFCFVRKKLRNLYLALHDLAFL